MSKASSRARGPVDVRDRQRVGAVAASLRCLLVLGVLAAGAAQAQFASTPIPLTLGEPAPSQADDPKAYRPDGARHLYYSYPTLVYRGVLPQMLHAVAIVETTIDEKGVVEKIEVVREPAIAKEATPWIVSLIRGAQPYPPAARQGKVIYKDIWLVTENGKFQLDAITEGQVHKAPDPKSE
jgi:protein TonB